VRLIGEGLQPDLVVTDHLMPGLSGLDLARSLQSRRPDLPVLIVSGYAEMDGIAPGFERLTRPVPKRGAGRESGDPGANESGVAVHAAPPRPLCWPHGEWLLTDLADASGLRVRSALARTQPA
jgi:CheY-like chemotaxis protein